MILYRHAHAGRGDEMAVSAARMKANHKYDAKTYTRMTVRVKNTDLDRIKQAMGTKSVNAFLNEAIMEKVDRELNGK